MFGYREDARRAATLEHAPMYSRAEVVRQREHAVERVLHATDGEYGDVEPENMALIASYRTAAPDLARALKAVAEALEEFRSDAKCNDWSLAQAADMFRAAIEQRLVKP